MKLNPFVPHAYSVFLLILVLFGGCGEDMTDQEIATVPEIATVSIEFTLPDPPAPPEVDGPFCKTGDVLLPGDSCFYPGTDIEISVFDDGTLKILNLFINAKQIHFENTNINNTSITLIAQRFGNNLWIIEKVGNYREVRSLEVIISTDFTVTPKGEITYNTKHEFALTESFSQDFPLDPDDPSLAVEITNNTHQDLSVHLTVLVDGEVEVDERESFTRREKSIRWWTWSTTNE